jgi:DNA-binding NarL/FixJ family response regulator
MHPLVLHDGTAPLTVAIRADDDAAEREAAELLIAAGIAVERWTGSRSGGRHLLLIVLTASAGERVDAIRTAADQRSGPAIVATMPGDAPSSLLRRALRAGADGIVLEAELHVALVASVRAVAAGQLAVPLALRRQLAPRHLSYREKQVLSLVAVGYTNRQIADTLYLSESTVKTHLSSAFGKLDARSRAEAAARVLDPDEGLSLTVAPLVAEVSASAA